MANNEPLLRVRDLRTSFHVDGGIVRAVDGLSFHVDRGETLAIVGESGSGKSVASLSLLRLLPIPPARIEGGEALLGGVDLLAMSEAALRRIRGNRIAMIFQDPMSSLNPFLRVSRQLTEVLELHKGMGRQAARERSIEMLSLVGIPEPEVRIDAWPHELSGGMRQRVMVAMALLCQPEVLIADEPTTALDVTIQAQILLLLAALQREFRMALILITHDLGVVARVADRVAVMYAGQIVEQGSVEKIFETPLHPYTQGLLSCIPIPGKTARGSHLGSIPGMVPSMIGDIQGCHFRDRCPHAWPDCAASAIPLRPIGDDRAYRCLLSPEQSAANVAALEVAE